MRKFVKRTVTFLFACSVGYTILLVIIILLNRAQIKNCDLDDNITAIILGDSHTMWSINDADIKNLRNISLNGEGYIYSYDKLKYVLNNEPSIKKVYLGMGYHNMSSYFDDYIYGNIFRHFIHRYLGVLTLNDYFKIATKNPKNITGFSIKILQNGSETLFKKKCELYGSFPEEKMLETLERENIKKRIKSQYYKNNDVAPLSEINLYYLNKIVELCKEREIDITILSTPIHKEYKREIPERYIKIYNDFIQKNQLKLYDFSDLNLPDSCFLPDADHVNYYGSIVTTQKFKDYHEKNFKL